MEDCRDTVYIEINRTYSEILAESRISHYMIKEWAANYNKSINLITSGPHYIRFTIEDERDYVLFLLTWTGPRITNVKLVHKKLDNAYRI